MMNGNRVGEIYIDSQTGNNLEGRGCTLMVNMVETEVECCKIISEDVENASVIEGSPELGLIGNIVGWLLVEELKMKEIGHIESKYFPTRCSLQRSCNTSIQDLCQR